MCVFTVVSPMKSRAAISASTSPSAIRRNTSRSRAVGLGGWSLGALVVLSALPGVRITDLVVVVPSVAVPIEMP